MYFSPQFFIAWLRFYYIHILFIYFSLRDIILLSSGVKNSINLIPWNSPYVLPAAMQPFDTDERNSKSKTRRLNRYSRSIDSLRHNKFKKKRKNHDILVMETSSIRLWVQGKRYDRIDEQIYWRIGT